MKKYLPRSVSRVENLDLDDAFLIFKDSYEKSTGKSWSREKFIRRAKNWEFFGDSKGFVAVRHQRSGLVKLTGVAGSMKSVLKGFRELKSKKFPLWGMVDNRLASSLEKAGFIRPSAYIVKTMIRFIPKEVFGGVDFEIQKDGGIKFKYVDVGDAVKYFVGTPEYFEKTIEELKNRSDVPGTGLLIKALKKLIGV